LSASPYGRPGLSFLRLLSFEYRDTKRMYTFGGIMVDKALRRKVVRVAKKWPFYCRDKLKNVKHIPHLIMTRKERIYLDERLIALLPVRSTFCS
jgi:hypothetical protein